MAVEKAGVKTLRGSGCSLNKAFSGSGDGMVGHRKTKYTDYYAVL